MSQIKLVFGLMRDDEVPQYLKLIPVAVALYVISPIDIMPGLFPDDALAVLMGLDLFIRLIPKHVVARHKGEDDDIVDATYTDKAGKRHKTINLDA